MGAALQYAYLTAARGESPEVGILLEGFPYLLALLVAAILVGVATLVGFVLLVIPGIYVALRLGFVPLLVVDRGLDGLEAVKVCWSGMGGNILGLFLLALASMVIAFGGLLLLVVGIIPAGVWIMSSFAAYYRAVFDEPEPTPTDAVEPETDEPLHVPDAETA